jgi:transcriptional regulator with XRE-family HTH domain
MSQRKLELLLGLSQGYLSRLRAGKGAPSPELVSHLALIAHDPKVRLLELERYWATLAGLPVQEDE